MRRPATFPKCLLLLCAILLSGHAASTEPDTWYRQPAVSPDGRQVVFTAYGDLWLVPASGGTAAALTRDAGWDGHPVWSRDGERIAFASDRFGDLDIFVMNLDGSGLTRLTFHDADDLPSDFSPDGSRVLFSSARGDSASSSYFPTARLPELYEVPVAGGPPRMVFTNPAVEARWSPDGMRIAYREEKAYENEWRQRDVSAFARDIWVYDVATGTHERVTDNPGADHTPVWSADGSALFMQSEIDRGSANVRRLELDSGDSDLLTSHRIHPARGLSLAGNNLLVYSWHGDLYALRPGGESRSIDVRLPTGRLSDAPRPLPATESISEFAVSPDGREIAYVYRGEIFVTDAEFVDTVRVTDTPGQERSVSFAPDGRALVYAAEDGNEWAIYETRLVDANEPRFSAATAFESRRIYGVAGGDAFQPLISPDGEKIAFIENRDAIRVVGRDGSRPRTVFPARYNYSYSDGDIVFDWSPDSRWITASYSPRDFLFFTEIGIAPADGSAAPRDISLNGYQDGYALDWHVGGDVIYWFSDRFGRRAQNTFDSDGDFIAAFLTEGAWTRFNLTKQERALLDAGTPSDEEDEGDDDGYEIDVAAYLNLPPPRAADSPVEIDFDAIEDRTARLTVNASDLVGAALTRDLSALYYLAAFEGGYDLWRHDLHDDKTEKVAALDAGTASLALAGDDEAVVILADGKLMRAELGDELEMKPVELDAEMLLRPDSERDYLFDHVWRQVNDKFYDPDFHGVDWEAMRAAYEPKVAGVSTSRDFAILMSEMLGRLNASHTGMYYRPPGETGDDDTAALGAIFDLDGGPGLRIAEVLDGGPLDRMRLDIRAGDRIVAIGDARLGEETNPFEFLNRRAGDRLRLTIARNGERERSIRIRAWSRGEESDALYERWIERRRAIVEERSGGRVGYFHIRSMSDPGFRQAYTELFGRNFDKEAVIVDTRFNGGGWLHDELITMLDGEAYFNIRARDRIAKGAPVRRWTRPSAVVMNEGNYSNAHMFPYAYALFDIGPLVGMPVPGTATAVWWENLMTGDLRFGIPQLPALDQQNRPLENQQLAPDIRVDNPPADAARGIDRPLEAAVDALLRELDAP
jgi:tricorn protease